MDASLCSTKENKGTLGFYLQNQGMSFGDILLRCHVEEGETNTQAVQGVVRVSLEGLDILA